MTDETKAPEPPKTVEPGVVKKLETKVEGTLSSAVKHLKDSYNAIIHHSHVPASHEGAIEPLNTHADSLIKTIQDAEAAVPAATEKEVTLIGAKKPLGSA